MDIVTYGLGMNSSFEGSKNHSRKIHPSQGLKVRA
jgi:hypothetical protein